MRGRRYTLTYSFVANVELSSASVVNPNIGTYCAKPAPIVAVRPWVFCCNIDTLDTFGSGYLTSAIFVAMARTVKGSWLCAAGNHCKYWKKKIWYPLPFYGTNTRPPLKYCIVASVSVNAPISVNVDNNGRYRPRSCQLVYNNGTVSVNDDSSGSDASRYCQRLH